MSSVKGSKNVVVQSVLGQKFHLNSQADALSFQHLLLNPHAFWGVLGQH